MIDSADGSAGKLTVTLLVDPRHRRVLARLPDQGDEATLYRANGSVAWSGHL